MSTQAADTSVRTQIEVETPVERAFQAFFGEMASWWNPDHHLVDGQVAEMVVEPRVGGHIYDRSVDGSECRWARVLVYDPPHRVVFTWDINAKWEIETDLDKTSEVEVRFIPEGPDRTRVELEHRNLERHGDGWEGIRDAIASPGGWPDSLTRFADYLK